MRLAVNIDHVATVRQARRADEPDPVAAAVLCELAGARGITVHLRGDRRHIQDRDVEILRNTVSTHLNVEMAATREMIDIALRVRPHQVTLVPEKPDELTTEGGLNVVAQEGAVRRAVGELVSGGIDVSIFVDPDPGQIAACREAGSPAIEINTGRYAEQWRDPRGEEELEKVRRAARQGRELGLRVLAGHGLTYRNIHPIASIVEIEELNIGHSIVARATLVGLEAAVREMIAAMRRSVPSA